MTAHLPSSVHLRELTELAKGTPAEAETDPARQLAQLAAQPGTAGTLSGWAEEGPRHPEVSVGEFLGGTEWNPLLGEEKKFGIWPLITGTLLITAIAAIFALPIGLVTAIFLSEYAPMRARNIIKPILEILAGVPTVVFGFFALTVLTPGLNWLGQVYNSMVEGTLTFDTYNAMAAGLAVGIMILPIVTSLAEDALRSVPRSLCEIEGSRQDNHSTSKMIDGNSARQPIRLSTYPGNPPWRPTPPNL